MLGAISADGVNDHLGVALAVTGLLVGISRYGAVLRGTSRRGVERATAFGFFYGLLLSAATLVYLLVD